MLGASKGTGEQEGTEKPAQAKRKSSNSETKHPKAGAKPSKATPRATAKNLINGYSTKCAHELNPKKEGQTGGQRKAQAKPVKEKNA